jgi:hypothetical protein
MPGTSQRIKGQEISVLITEDDVLQANLVDTQNFNDEDMLEVLSHGYLGEKTERKDEVYKGKKFDLEMHLHDGDWFDFKQAIKDRAQRIRPNLVFNITVVWTFPNGQTRVVAYPNVHFGAIPTAISTRNDYVKVKLQGECEDDDVAAA